MKQLSSAIYPYSYMDTEKGLIAHYNTAYGRYDSG